ncbi:MAG: AraC family transcriptional regulator, partial [Rhodanobacter sp.]
MIYAGNAMISSPSSKISRDPFSDVLNALEIRSVRRTRLEASGDWSLRFPA